MMMARAVHLNREPYDIRIDRRTRWGNPFKLRKNAPDAERDEALAKYEAWLIPQITCGDVTDEDLAALHGKRFGCWCAPKRCHGDILAKYAAEAARRLGSG